MDPIHCNHYAINSQTLDYTCLSKWHNITGYVWLSATVKKDPIPVYQMLLIQILFRGIINWRKAIYKSGKKLLLQIKPSL